MFKTVVAILKPAKLYMIDNIVFLTIGSIILAFDSKTPLAPNAATKLLSHKLGQ